MDPRITPFSAASLRGLFVHLDQLMWNGWQCDHSFHRTLAFLDNQGMSVEHHLHWLHTQGAACDCEVLNNVATVWETYVGYSAG